MDILIIAGVDVSHLRLVDLANLADQAKPFYDWVEHRFQVAVSDNHSLTAILSDVSLEQIHAGISSCYFSAENRLCSLMVLGGLIRIQRRVIISFHGLFEMLLNNALAH